MTLPFVGGSTSRGIGAFRLENAELVAKSQGFRDEHRTPEKERAEQDDDNAHDAHGYASVWDL